MQRIGFQCLTVMFFGDSHQGARPRQIDTDRNYHDDEAPISNLDVDFLEK